MNVHSIRLMAFFLLITVKAASQIMPSNPSLLNQPPRIPNTSFMIFAAGQSFSGIELWITDGTARGTKELKDINPGQASSNPNNFVQFKNKVYFCADNGLKKNLWVTDGTRDGTRIVNEDVSASNLIATPDFIFFSGAGSGGYGRELWKSDGTAPGTVMVKDIEEGEESSFPGGFVFVGNKLLFSARTSKTGTELWRSNGTERSTQLVKDINPGTEGSSPLRLIAFNNRVLFAANDGVHGSELWISNGYSAQTRIVKDLILGPEQGGPSSFTLLPNNKVVFADVNGQIWSTQGTRISTVVVQTDGAGSVPPMAVNGNYAYFTKNSKLYKTTGGGTAILLKDFEQVYEHNFPSSLTTFNNKVYFMAKDNTENRALWSTDGTVAGTLKLTDCTGCETFSGKEYIHILKAPVSLFPGSLLITHEYSKGNIYMYDPTIRPGIMTHLIKIGGNEDPEAYGYVGEMIFYKK